LKNFKNALKGDQEKEAKAAPLVVHSNSGPERKLIPFRLKDPEHLLYLTTPTATP
jgi:hypothetical protein